MNLSEDEHAFLRDLVKASRQKTSQVKWIDRDGSERVSSLTLAEASRLNQIAQHLGTSKSEVLRRAAHVPVAKNAPRKTPPPTETAGDGDVGTG